MAVIMGNGDTLTYRELDERSARLAHPDHPNWSTLGDIGHVDEDGYLHLTDRATFMIISGGANIYPQETENVLLEHPLVQDVAVFGIPHAEMGEQVKAVVELIEGVEESPELAAELIAFVRARIGAYKAPKTVDFTARLPRTPTGKMMKRLLREPYWQTAAEPEPATV